MATGLIHATPVIPLVVHHAPVQHCVQRGIILRQRATVLSLVLSQTVRGHNHIQKRVMANTILVVIPQTIRHVQVAHRIKKPTQVHALYKVVIQVIQSAVIHVHV